MTLRQREGLAKYLYDLSKILFATTGVGNLLAGDRFNVIALLAGGLVAGVFFGWGYALEGVEEK